MKSLVFSGLIALAEILGGPRPFSAGDEPAKIAKESPLKDPWIQKHLNAMKEPTLWSLADKDRTATVYRFLWLPSFHNPISVRFVKTDEGVTLHAVRLNGSGGYEPGSILSRKSTKLSRAHWARIASLLVKTHFWTLPTHQPSRGKGFDTDGDFLIVEGVCGGKYHVVRRHCPRGGDFVDLCRAMLFMSGIDVRRLWFEYRE